MVGLEANYADGVPHALVGKLGQLLSEEYRLLSSVRGEVGHLRDDVSVMNALLHMLSEADDGAVNHFVRAWMKQVRELAYDAEDCIDIFVLRISCVPRSPRMLGAARARHLIVTLRARRRLAADIQALRARAVAIAERRLRYSIDGQALQPSVSFGATASFARVLGGRASSANDPSQFVGIKDQVDSLSEKVKSVEMTTSDNQPDRRVKVFFIVGFGGLGKTTLAEEVRRNLKEEFTCQAIVSVSQAFHASKDMDGLLGRIHQQVIMEKKEEIASTTTLNQDLKEKRYLIVIDDVWTISDCDAIRSKLPENNNSSRIIVTTRIESVAKTCIPTSAWGHYIHRVEPLKPEDSKRLFIDRVFGQSSLRESQLPTRAPGVVELTITGVKTLLYHSVSGALSKIVPWVFGHVPRTEALLIDLPPSQASVCPEELREAMDEILRKCVSLVGGLCGGTSYDTVRRLSIQGELLDSSYSVEEMSFRHVRSLSSFFPEIKGNLLDRRLPEFSLLRVLDLQGCKEMRNHHLKHICDMFLLRFLNLNDTDITELPTEIGELRHLQTLWLHDTLLDRVPESLIQHLEKLEDLSFWNRNDWDKYASLPLGLRKMKALRVMPRQELHEGDAELAKEVGDLVQLQKININLQCTDCWDKPVLKELGISIGKLRSLRELGIEDMKLTYANNLRFLQHLPSPPQLLRKLKIGGQMDRIPHWVESLTHLVSIEFWWINMPGDEIYGVLHKLPNLLRISLDRGCCNEEELVARTTSVFPVLKVLEFHRNELPKVIRFEKQPMENLTRLRVCFDDEHRRLTGVKNLIRLQEVVLVGKRNITALHDAMDQMKTESQSREESKQFKIIVTYMSD